MLEEDWMEWVPMVGRYEIPLDLGRSTLIDYKLRNGTDDQACAGDLEWDASQEEPESDIVAYRRVVDV